MNRGIQGQTDGNSNEEGADATEKSGGEQDAAEELASDGDHQCILGPHAEGIRKAAELGAEVVQLVPAVKTGHVDAHHRSQDEQDDV